MLDSCTHTDEALADLFEKLKNSRNLGILSIANCKIGQKSAENLLNILPRISEIRLSNISGIDQLKSTKFVEKLFQNGLNLNVLKLSHINIASESTLKAVEHFIEHNQLIGKLDLSHCCLRAKHLLRIVQKLKQFPNHVKQLNLSYNMLKGGVEFEEYMEDDLDVTYCKIQKNESTEFIFELAEYLKKSSLINHLDISGLQLMDIVIKHANSN